MSGQTKFLLQESQMPKAWYNLQADLPKPLPAVLHPGTHQPVGPDDLAPLFPMELILQGGQGNISVTANIAPRQLAELCRLALEGDRAGAARINERLAPLNRALFLEANPIPVKWAMHQRGLIEAGIRLPLTPLEERFHAQVLAAMEAAGI